jgi:heme/copper-type cytochrome/quinol oxidase subunit 3
MFWIVLAVLLTVSATLNAYAVVAADDRSTQLLRGGLSVTLLLLAALSVRKGLAERSVTQEGPLAQSPQVGPVGKE